MESVVCVCVCAYWNTSSPTVCYRWSSDACRLASAHFSIHRSYLFLPETDMHPLVPGHAFFDPKISSWAVFFLIWRNVWFFYCYLFLKALAHLNYTKMRKDIFITL